METLADQINSYPYPFDPGSDYNLRDVLEGRLPAGETTEAFAFHLTAFDDTGRVLVFPDGYGPLTILEPDEYEDILELVSHLYSMNLLWYEGLSPEEQVQAANMDFTAEEMAAIEQLAKVRGDLEMAQGVAGDGE